MTSRQNPLLKAFILASSLPVTLWPLAGLGLGAYFHDAPLNFAPIAIMIPAVFGFYHLACIAFGLRKTRGAYFVAGLFLGLLLASFGTYVLHLPTRVYGLEGGLQYIALVLGPLFYAVLWALVLWPLQVGYGVNDVNT